jgi:hypothetical protein
MLLIGCDKLLNRLVKLSNHYGQSFSIAWGTKKKCVCPKRIRFSVLNTRQVYGHLIRLVILIGLKKYNTISYNHWPVNPLPAYDSRCAFLGLESLEDRCTVASLSVICYVTASTL